MSEGLTDRPSSRDAYASKKHSFIAFQGLVGQGQQPKGRCQKQLHGGYLIFRGGAGTNHFNDF